MHEISSGCNHFIPRASMAGPLPHLQFAVLAVLSSGPTSGRTLRTRLAELGLKKGGPAFYRLMGRLEEAGLIEGWYERDVVEEQSVRERWYRVTTEGSRARDRTARFHERVISTYSGREPSSA